MSTTKWNAAKLGFEAHRDAYSFDADVLQAYEDLIDAADAEIKRLQSALETAAKVCESAAVFAPEKKHCALCLGTGKVLWPKVTQDRTGETHGFCTTCKGTGNVEVPSE